MYKVGNSHVVSLPPACIRLLGVPHGGTVQVVPQASGKVVVAPMRARLGVAAEMVSAQREVRVLRMQVGKLRRRLTALPERALSKGVNIGMQKGLSALLLDLTTRVENLTTTVQRLAVRAGDPMPLPSPPFLFANSEGEALAPGPSVPGQPNKR